MFSWKWKEEKAEINDQSATEDVATDLNANSVVQNVQVKDDTTKGDMDMSTETMDAKSDYDAVLEKIKAEKEVVAKRKLETQRAEEYEVVISKNTFINGDTTITGKTRIDGTIEGNLTVDSDLLVGETGLIKAKIIVKNAIICGTIEGDLLCRGRLQLNSTARVTGDIKTHVLVVAEGAALRGTFSEIEPEEVAEPETNQATTVGAPVTEVPADYVW